MSFRPATKELNQTKQLTTLYLIGGYDADPNVGKSSLHVDLRVAGGAYIKKNVIVSGNTYVSTLFGNIAGNIKTSLIDPLLFGGEIKMTGNLHMAPNVWILSEYACLNNILTETISQKYPDQGITVTGNVKVDENVVATKIIGNTIQCPGNNLTILAPNNININASNVNLQKTNLIGVQKIEGSPGCPIQLSTDQRIEIIDGSGIELFGTKNIANANIITTYEIKNIPNFDLTIHSTNDIVIDPENGKTIIDSDVLITGNVSTGNTVKDLAIISNLDLSCYSVKNVETLFGNTLSNKTVNVGIEIPGAGNVIPLINNIYSLGNSTKKWNHLYTDYANVCTLLSAAHLTVQNDVFIGGNFTVQGNSIISHRIAANIELNTLTLNANVPITGIDSGICIERFQSENDIGLGDLSNDNPTEQGTVTSALAGSVVLSPSASGANGFYNDWFIKITSGGGANQIRKIVSYNGISKTASLNTNWTTIPSPGNNYALLPCKFITFFWDASARNMNLACVSNCATPQFVVADYVKVNVGDIESENIIPRANLTHNIGSSLNVWNHLYVKDITTNGNLDLSCGNVTNVNAMYTDNIYAKTNEIVLRSPPIINHNLTQENQFWGYQSGRLLTNGMQNTTVGHYSLKELVSGNVNVAVGSKAAANVSLGSHNVAIGGSTLLTSTVASYNVAIGANALKYNDISFNNVAIGYAAAKYVQDSQKLVAIGSQAMEHSNNNEHSVAIGSASMMYSNANFSIALGGYSLYTVDGNCNIAVGYESGKGAVNSRANKNVFIGHKTGRHVGNVHSSVLIGHQAGNTLVTGIQNTLIGANTDVSTPSITNAIAIGAGTVATNNRNVHLGADDASPVAGILKFRTQTVSNEVWVDGTNKLATIDGTGNLVKGGSGTLTLGGHLDLECYGILNVNNAEVGNLSAKDSTGIKFLGKPVLEFNDPNRNQFWGYQSGTFGGGTALMNTTVGSLTLETLTEGDNNTAVGACAMKNAVIANNNTAVGANALHDLITGNNNVALGYQALEQNASGSRNIGIGVSAMQLGTSTNDTVAIGYFALSDNIDGDENVGVGNYALRYNDVGFNNTAIGFKSSFNNSIGNENTSVGHYSLHNNMSGNSNAAFGSSAMAALETGHQNVAIGATGLSGLISGGNNVGIGVGTGATLSSGSNNILIGTGTNVSSASATDRIAMGTNSVATIDRDVQLGADAGSGSGRLRFRKQTIARESWIDSTVQLAYIDGTGNFGKGGTGTVSLTADSLNMECGNITNVGNIQVDTIYSKDTTGTVAFMNEPIIGYMDSAKNQFWGYNSGRLVSSGQRNTAIGSNAMVKVTSGVDNTAGGYNALNKVTMGANNTAFGRGALTTMATGSNNTAIGRLASWKAESVNRTTAIGSSALQENLIGNDNTAVGFNVLQSCTGAYNTALGTEAGSSLTSGKDNVIIGKSAGAAGTYSHLSAIALVTGGKNIIIGSAADVDGTAVAESVVIGYKSVVTGGGVAIGYNTEATGTNSIAIGHSAVVTMNHHVQIGESSDSGTSAAMKFRSQIVSDETWIDGTNQLCIIDSLGNLTKGLTTPISINGNLDMNCYIISNTEQLHVNKINSKDSERIQFNNTTSLYRLSTTTTNENAMVLLLDNLMKPEVPLGARWCGTIELVGGVASNADMYCERQTFSAVNFGGNVTVSILSSDFDGSNSLDGSALNVVGNASNLDITITSASPATAKWVASLLVTELII